MDRNQSGLQPVVFQGGRGFDKYFTSINISSRINEIKAPQGKNPESVFLDTFKTAF